MLFKSLSRKKRLKRIKRERAAWRAAFLEAMADTTRYFAEREARERYYAAHRNDGQNVVIKGVFGNV